ncbi:MAG: glycoside hydrolase family 76 protein [Bacteroidota bacterium]|nr:glycoside hydrolase family 76 protein [Bacteroidota bacterium]
MKKFVLIVLSLAMPFLCIATNVSNSYVSLSDSTLNLIYKYYSCEENNKALNETYPFNPQNVASYVVSRDTVTKKRVAYLWPTSGVFSGVVALLSNTNDARYKALLDTKVIPGLELYYDATRPPACYQSYLASEGKSDRFYDDNVWLAIEFAQLALVTKEPKYLEKAEEIWRFVISGWDDQLGGGIFWCEQEKGSKNTCSNAPSVVAAAKLYQATNKMEYLNWAKRIYSWTKLNLQDKSDYLFYDNISLKGRVAKRKYAYNSGQMLQGAALLYKITGEKAYLADAKQIAKSSIQYFTVGIKRNDKSYRVFKEQGAWFVTVLSRGYFELYAIDKDPQYINFFKSNMDYLRKYARYDNGLFYGDWSGNKTDAFKWLLDQGCIVELAANLSGCN